VSERTRELLREGLLEHARLVNCERCQKQGWIPAGKYRLKCPVCYGRSAAKPAPPSPYVISNDSTVAEDLAWAEHAEFDRLSDQDPYSDL
jgi:hypothetical protein